MATSSTLNIYAFKANADLSAKQFHFVKVDATGKLVTLCGLGEAGCGVLQNAPKNGEVAEVAIFGGGAKVKCAGIIPANASIASDANGQAIVAIDGQFAFGTATKTTVANEVIGMELTAHIKYVKA